MIRSVLFDLDGTLLNTIDDLADAGNWVCQAHGWPQHTAEEYKYFVGNGIPKLVERFSPEDQRSAEQLARTLEEFNARYSAHKEDRTAPYAGIAAMLQALRAQGIQMGVLSNKEDTLAQQVVEHYFPGVFQFVRGAVAGCPTKPDPAGLYALMDTMGADAASSIFVGDSSVDVYTGKNGGLPVCGVLWGFRGREELLEAGADRLITEPSQLVALVQQGQW